MSALCTESIERPLSSDGKTTGTNGSQSSQHESFAASLASEGEPLVLTMKALEAQIERNRRCQLLIGRDLKIIRDHPEYYRSAAKSWDLYCKGRFGFGKRQANYYVAAWMTAQNCGVPDDFSPRILRPLTGLSPEYQRQAWATATALSRSERPSSRDISIAASQFSKRPLAAWTERAAQRVGEQYFRLGFSKALVGANEEQARDYSNRLLELVQDWARRHSPFPRANHRDKPSECHSLEINGNDEGDFNEAQAAAHFESYVRQTVSNLSEAYEFLDLDPKLAKSPTMKKLLKNLRAKSNAFFAFLDWETKDLRRSRGNSPSPSQSD